MNVEEPEPLLVGTKEAGRMLRVSDDTIRRLIVRKALPVVLVGSRWRIPVKALERFAAQGGRTLKEAA